MIFDPLYFILLAPALLLGLWAQFKVKSAYHKGAQAPIRSGLTGAEAARMILDRNGLRDVGIELSHGTLSDHYDPKAKVLRLSHDVAYGRTASSLGIAAHEAGHAIQDATHYGPLRLRNGIVPFAAVGGNLSMILFMVGLVLSAASGLGQMLMLVAIGLFTLTVVFQLVNLPVEFDASNRARAILAQERMVTEDEAPVVKKVLSAAALTYVAATLTAILTLVYLIIRAQGNRQ